MGGTFGYAALTTDGYYADGPGGAVTAGLHGFAGSVVSIDLEAGVLVLPVSARVHSFGGLFRLGFGFHFR